MNQFIRLRYCHYWIVVGLLWLFSLLPYSVLVLIGKALGRLGYWLAKKRRHIVRVNIAICFPDLSANQQHVLVKKHFGYLGLYLIESIVAWFFSDRRFNKIKIKFNGVEIYNKACRGQAGIILLGCHMMCIELILRAYCQRQKTKLGLKPHYLFYAEHKNPFVEWFITSRRLKYADGAWRKSEFKGMIRSVRQGGAVSFFADQDFGLNFSVFAPFFNFPTATLKSLPQVIKLSHAIVLPFTAYRVSGGSEQYHVEVAEPIDPHHLSDSTQAARYYNQLVEEVVRQHPAQYLWAHRRFKTRPDGEKSPYDD